MYVQIAAPSRIEVFLVKSKRPIYLYLYSEPTETNISIVSIGGGPGTDMLGVLAAQTLLFGQYPHGFTFHIFDQAALEWEDTLKSVFEQVEELGHRYECYQLSLPMSLSDYQDPVDLVYYQTSMELADY